LATTPILEVFQMTPLSTDALNQLFKDAHTANVFTDQAVSADTLRAVYDLAKMGPTSMNCQPGRFVFLITAAAREKLIPHLMDGNKEKTRHAPVTVIVATDSRFYDNMPSVWHGAGAKEMFAGNAALAQATATRNGTLTGAYFILAARAMGLDCGPMSGFDAAGVDATFFPEGRYQANFLINMGYADKTKFHPRNRRLTFAEAAQVV
jgi:nitroreductase